MTERELFEAALDQEPNDRPAFLDRVCAATPAMRKRLDALLARQEQACSFLVGPAAAENDTEVSRPKGASPTIDVAGQVLAGRYQLIEQIGEGGMGTVWLAMQTEPVHRGVAVKLVKAGMDSRQVLWRFEAERQALALMDHPNIAKVLDGGTTPQGRPFFVMEYVKGVPMTQYCDEAALTVTERLELFVTICKAVQHAHQKGVIHRDLKPTNLLICVHDGKPVPKVIDFGLAKAMHQPLTQHTLDTAPGLMLGTPLYMSPEQADLTKQDVDTRSDIYSLGVVLYELLTGTTPLEKEQLKQASWPEVLRLIKETEPPRPSTRFAEAASSAGRGSSNDTAPSFCRPVRLAPRRFQELDWIVMKALDKDRNRRYETASALAADAERYLRDEPVTACPPSAWYRLHKLVRRKRGVLTMVLVVAAALVLGTAAIGGSIGWALNDRAARAATVVRDKEVREAALDEQVNRELDEAAAVIDTVQWPAAAPALTRAEKLLIAAGRIDLPSRLQAMQRDLTMVRRLEQIPEQPDDAILHSGYETSEGHQAANAAYTQKVKEVRMQLGFVSAILPELTLEEVLAFASDEGFGCVELMCWPPGGADRRYAGVTHLDVTGLGDEQAGRVRDLVKKSGITISGLGYYPNPLHPEQQHRERVVAHLKQVIRAAPRVGVPVVNTFVGRDPRRSVLENWPVFDQIWPGILATAEEAGVSIGIENCPMLFSYDEWPGGANLATTPAIWSEMFAKLPSPRFGLNFDPSHLIWQHIDPVRCVREFGKRIVHFHAKDTRIDGDAIYRQGIMGLGWHTPKLPGLGDVPWGPLFSALTDTGYQGPICIEVEDRAFEGSLADRRRSLRQSKRFLEQFIG